MKSINKRNLFPGGNTSKGFYSFYRYILPQDKARKIICIKGGPGTGKSSFMKKLGAHFEDLGYSLEYHHCSSDNNSLDGIVIKELNVALLDGTAPHIVDPINPGAVDEILNLGTALDMDYLYGCKKEILNINKEIGKCFKRAYRFLGAAKNIHEDWSSIHCEFVNKYALNGLIDELSNKIILKSKDNLGLERHLFSTAFTPNGIVSFNKELSSNIENLYVLKGGPGLFKTNILKSIGSKAQKNGYFVEYLHDPFIPERMENIIIPELNTAIFTTNEISNVTYDTKNIYNMIDICYKSSVNSKIDEIFYDKKEFSVLIDKGLSCIKEAKSLHDKLESYYIKAMDFNIVNKLYIETEKKIESFIK